MLGKSEHQCGLRRSKNRLVTTAGVETSGQMGNEKLRAAVARSVFSSQNVTHQLRTTVQSSDVEKCHPAAVPSTFPIPNKKTLFFFLLLLPLLPQPSPSVPHARPNATSTSDVQVCTRTYFSFPLCGRACPS